MKPDKLFTYLIGFFLLFVFLGAKPLEIVHFNQITPLVNDSITYSSPQILKFHRTYCFKENRFVSIVDLIDRKNAILYFEIKDTAKPITSYILNLSIDLSRGDPKFYANYNCEYCLSWMIYKTAENTNAELVLAKLNKQLPQKGNKGYQQSKHLEYIIVKSEYPDTFRKNYLLNRIQIGESSPFGCYFLEHDIESKEEGTFIETVWFCEGMTESKGKINLLK